MEAPQTLLDNLQASRQNLLGLIDLIRRNVALLPRGEEFDDAIDDFIVGGEEMVAWTEELLVSANDGIDIAWLESCSASLSALADYQQVVDRIDLLCQVAQDLRQLDEVPEH